MAVDALEALRTRRSYGRLDEPGPTESELRTMLELAAAAPDHGDLRPFRFTILRDASKDAFGEVLHAGYLRRCESDGVEPVPAKAAKERTKLGRAPLVVVVSAVRQADAKIPWVDQRDAAVAATENLLIASHALGYGAIWRTGDPCTDPHVRQALHLGVGDAIVGFVYVGTAATVRPPRDVDIEALLLEFSA